MWIVTTAGKMVNIALAKRIDVRCAAPRLKTAPYSDFALVTLFSAEMAEDLATAAAGPDSEAQIEAFAQAVRNAIAEGRPLLDLSGPAFGPSGWSTGAGPRSQAERPAPSPEKFVGVVSEE